MDGKKFKALAKQSLKMALAKEGITEFLMFLCSQRLLETQFFMLIEHYWRLMIAIYATIYYLVLPFTPLFNIADEGDSGDIITMFNSHLSDEPT